LPLRLGQQGDAAEIAQPSDASFHPSAVSLVVFLRASTGRPLGAPARGQRFGGMRLALSR
jgi:hypothetical protein